MDVVATERFLNVRQTAEPALLGKGNKMNVVTTERFLNVRQTAEPNSSETRLSTILTRVYLLTAATMVAAVTFGLLWISDRHNQLARNGALEMVTTKIDSFEQNQRDMNADNSIWTEAYDAILNEDIDWLYNNIGTAAMIGTVDLVAFVPRHRAPLIGWMAETPPEGSGDLVPPRIVTDLLDRLGQTDPESKAVVSTYARFNGDYWLLSATRVINTEGVPEGVADEAIPRQIRGVRASELAVEIQQQFSLSQVQITEGAVPTGSSVDGMLFSLAGTDEQAALVWSPPRPGSRILRQAAAPLAAILLVFFAAGALLSGYATSAARRLETALFDAQVAVRAKTEFLGVVSHELRTPMNGILGLGQVLETLELGPRQRQLLTTMMKCARSQMRMIESLLDMTQLGTGKRILQEGVFDLSRVAHDVAEVARLECEAKGLKLVLEDTSPPSLVRGDEEAIRRIVSNLIDNAVKFTKVGTVTLRVSATPAAAPTQAYRISVIDTGVGIDAVDHERVFQRFTQLDASVTRAVDGLGLGLPICQSLAEVIGGEITVESERGRGSTFTLTAVLRLVETPRDEEAA